MTDSSLNVLIVSGGLTHERDISLRSGARVANFLKHAGHSVTVTDVDNTLLSKLRELSPDVVWPLVHGSIGEDGTLQDIFEVAGVRYVGSGPQACRLASSKPVAKSVVAKNHLNTPTFVALTQDAFRQLGAIDVLDVVAPHLGFPLIVKPANGGSALGITKVENADQLRSAMVDALAYGEQVQIEQFVPGIEVAVSIVEDSSGKPVTLPAVEVTAAEGRYDFDARYNPGRSEFFVPARLDDDVLESCYQLALDCHRVLELSDYSRIDMIVDAEGTPWFIDANVAPGITDTSLLPMAAGALSADEVSAIVCDEALDVQASGSEVNLQQILSHLAIMATK